MTFDFDRLVPRSVREEGGDAIRRARVLVLVDAIMVLVGGYIAWVQLLYGDPLIGGAGLGIASAAIASLLLLLWTGAWRVLGIAAGVLLFCAAGSVVAASGGHMPAASFYLCFVPLVFTLILGARWGAGSAVAVIVFLTGVEYLRRSGVAFPLDVPEEIIAQSRYRAAVLFAVILLVLAIIYDLLRTFSLRDVAESETRYRAFSAGGTDLLCELDSLGRVVFVSEEHCATLGGTPEDALGRDLELFLHGEDVPAFRAALEQSRNTGAAAGASTRIRVRGEGWRRFEPSFTTYRTPGQSERTIVVGRDLTERLETERRLRHAQKMDAIGQLAAGVAHDFNNLLMVISSYAQMIERNLPEDSRHRRALEQIGRAAERGEGLTRQLNALGGPSAAELQPVALNPLVEGQRATFQRLVGDGVALALELEEELPPVLGDEADIEEVLVNLVLNARDAVAGSGAVRIRTQARGGRVLLAVVDDGVGIDPAIQDRIFEAFFTTKTRQEGTGLGLYVVYSLVRSMGAEVRVSSRVGVGTSIVLDFPARADLKPTPASSVLPSRGVTTGDETVLVVDDLDPVREIVGEALREAGYTVLEASSGPEGLAIAEAYEGPIHVVLSDVVMPQMSGPEMVQALRSERPESRVLFMSGHADEAEVLAKRLGDAPILMKPLLPDELCAHVRAVLDEDGFADSPEKRVLTSGQRLTQ